MEGGIIQKKREGHKLTHFIRKMLFTQHSEAWQEFLKMGGGQWKCLIIITQHSEAWQEFLEMGG